MPSYYNYSQPVLSSATIYSQPVYTNSIYTGSSPVMTTRQVVPASSQVLTDGGEIVLFSPPSNTQDVQYSLNGQTYTMKPGTVQRFTNDRIWIIEVTNAGGQSLQYTLSSGRYKFKAAGSGMGLFSTTDRPEDSVVSPTVVPPRPGTSTPNAAPPAPTPTSEL
jgi:hypothetical protein